MIALPFRFDHEFAVGDTLVWYSDIIPVSGDIDASNDNDSTWTRVAGAYDPNDKTGCK